MSGEVEPKWFRIEKAAEVYAISRTKLYELIKTKRIDARRVDGRTVVSRKSLDALLEQAPTVGAQ